MPLHFCRAFDYPIRSFFLFKAACITYPGWFPINTLHFSPWIHPRSNFKNFFTTLPQGNFSTTLIAVPMSIHWLEEPYSVFKPGSSVSEGTNRANINYIPAEIIFNCFRNIGRYL